MLVRAFGATDVGRKRTNNEDAFTLRPEHNLYVVADGMGGHSSGEVASQLAVSHINAFFDRHDLNQDSTWPYPYDEAISFGANKVRTAIAIANDRIQRYANEHPESRGMGTTVVAALVDGDEVVICHVGDSRAYLYAGGQLGLLTADHSWVSEQVRMGLLSDEEASRHPLRNVITKALGTKDQADADVLVVEPAVGDRILLCTDGLNSMATDAEISEVLAKKQDLDETARTLLALANARGGEDNITVILLERVE
jgi:serine/threonine protein phosphatase PrpC